MTEIEETTCGDQDEVSSMCSWTTDQGDDSDRYFPSRKGSAMSPAPSEVGSNYTNNDSMNGLAPWGYCQDSVSDVMNTGANNGINFNYGGNCYNAAYSGDNCGAQAPWPVFGYSLAAVPVMCYVVPPGNNMFGSEDSAGPSKAAGKWAKNTPARGRPQNNKVTKAPYVENSNFGGGKAAAESEYTTVILRNLPLECTRDMLLQILDSEGFWGCYDFLHLPVDFQTKAGLGYALLNLVNHKAAARVKSHFTDFSLWPVQSDNVCTVAWNTPQQGLAVHVDRYRNSPLMHASVPEGYRPVIFKNGLRVNFPAPNTRIRAPRIRHPKPGNACFTGCGRNTEIE
jgi:hypothetical protein